MNPSDLKYIDCHLFEAGRAELRAIYPDGRVSTGLFDKPAPLELDLNDLVDLSYARQKVIGSVASEEIHSFLRFHFYGQVPGEPARRMLSMNNYIVDRWEPIERGTYQLRHWAELPRKPLAGYSCL